MARYRDVWGISILDAVYVRVSYLPSNTAVWLSGDVGGLCELLAKVVPGQFLEEEIVQTFLSYETLNRGGP